MARAVWVELKRILNLSNLLVAYHSIASMWIYEKKNMIHNTVHAVALWVIWNTRNDIYFNRSPWIGLQKIWRRKACMLSQWRVLFSEPTRGDVDRVVMELELLARAPPLLQWPDPG